MWTHEPTSPCGILRRVLLREPQAGVVGGYLFCLFMDRPLNTVLLNLGSGVHMPEDGSQVCGFGCPRVDSLLS
jgi:hypothetical protein